jgi:hypothetical protein
VHGGSRAELPLLKLYLLLYSRPEALSSPFLGRTEKSFEVLLVRGGKERLGEGRASMISRAALSMFHADLSEKLWSIKKLEGKLGMVSHTYNTRTWEAEAGGLQS